MQLDQVLGLAAFAIDGFIEILRVAGQRRDHVADVETLRCRLDARDHLARLVPALGLIGEAGEGAHRLAAGFGPAHAQIVSNLAAQTIEDGVTGQAENEVGRVVLAPGDGFRPAVVAVAAPGDAGLGEMAAAAWRSNNCQQQPELHLKSAV